ncbi:hypothetical protein EIN_069690 [Entamoeba invadens IP1]|uniref:Uncharacterized protein n=1 Tax=Entamoeba invadens IP1 TaxID=370355 RepID=A0A0A1TUC4_ENTIV|nr:hypothetical protein EIN_069690 [Entamoeba invadens IP1]ELP83555.1 hypothetical protein EIN_069690 [Entamoeba invadens IP1]|eukprot:XP_004182901.1 hypothetical protein EIN_069690 [Entamoeba invadens IP1]
MFLILSLVYLSFALRQCYIEDLFYNSCIKYYDKDNSTDCDPNLVITIGTEICDYGFTNHDIFTSVTMEKAVKIGEMAFSGCTKLVSATFGLSLNSLGVKAFYGTRLTTFDLKNAEKVSNSAFESVTTLTTANGGCELKSVGDRAFYDCPITTLCPNENKVSYCPKLIYIGDEAFYQTNLITFKLSNYYGVELGTSVFANTKQMTTFDMSGQTIITANMFESSSITKIVGSEKVNFIRKDSLKLATGLTQLSTADLLLIEDNLEYVTTIFYHGFFEPIVQSGVSISTSKKVYLSENYTSSKFLGIQQTSFSCTRSQYYDINTNTCIDCQTGYYSFDGVDSECLYKASQCAPFGSCDINDCTDYQCVNCGMGHYYHPAGQSCVISCQGVVGFYVLNDGFTCVNCPENCKTCTESLFDSPSLQYTCTQCQDGYVMTSKGSCVVECPTSTNQAYMDGTIP